MNDLTLLIQLTNEQFLTHLQNNMKDRHLLDENRNLSLSDSSEQDFLELFFLEKIFTQDKQLSPHTIKSLSFGCQNVTTIFNGTFPVFSKHRFSGSKSIQ